MRDLIKVFKALSDPNRIRILKMLEARHLCVCEITDILKLAPSTVSKHLSLLRDVDFILDEKDGKWVNYSLNTSLTTKYINELLPLIKKWLPEDDKIKSDLIHVKSVDRNHVCSV
jgi:ArsR family transcriptional regulator, arsenate/arsenite/antimonite-responsive transcriptional repressor